MPPRSGDWGNLHKIVGVASENMRGGGKKMFAGGASLDFDVQQGHFKRKTGGSKKGHKTGSCGLILFQQEFYPEATPLIPQPIEKGRAAADVTAGRPLKNMAASAKRELKEAVIFDAERIREGKRNI